MVADRRCVDYDKDRNVLAPCAGIAGKGLDISVAASYGSGSSLKSVKKILPAISPELRDAVRFALVLQVILLLVASFVADYGEIFQICYFAFLGFSAFLFSVLIRRRTSPTAMDLLLIRAGYVPMMFVTAFLVNQIMTLRGY